MGWAVLVPLRLVSARSALTDSEELEATLSRSLHFPLNSLALRRGGLVKAVRDRASLLAEAGHSVTLEVLGGQSAAERVRRELVEAGALHSRVRVRDVLFSLAGPAGSPAPARAFALEPNETAYTERKGRVLRTFEDGVFSRYVRFVDATARQVEVIEHFGTDRLRFLREEFDAEGRLAARIDYRGASKKPVARRLYGPDGNCFLSIWADPETGRWGKAFLHSEGRAFASMTDLYVEAFERLLAAEPQATLTSEFRDRLPNFGGETFDDAFVRITHPDLRKVVVVHSNHLKAPFTRGSGMYGAWEQVLGEGERYDEIVTWTQAQAEDIAAEVPGAAPVAACPPAAPAPLSTPAPVDGQRFVLVARLHPTKRPDLALEVLRRVREQHPGASLDVFGFGYGDEYEAKIDELLDSSGLREHVTFHDFASNLGDIFDGAVATLFTSSHEGLGLVLLESMSRGVPVLALDANYGPRDIVVDGVNGGLFLEDDLAGMAARAAQLLDSPETRQALGQGALETAAGFTPERFVSFWEKTLDSGASERPVTRPQVVTSSSPRRVPPVVARVEATAGEPARLLPSASGEARAVVARRRSDQSVAAESAVIDGAWRLALPTDPSGSLLDLYLVCEDGIERRIDAHEDLPAELGGGWSLYATANGVLSLKRRA